MLHLDTGNTGFMLLCSSLVMLMTPGLAFFYGGLVGRKNVLAIMIQSFISLCWTTVVWYVCGYSLCFSGGEGGVIGNLDMAFLRGVNLMAPSPNDSIPLIVHVAYQMMFAIITPALITGAFANRVTLQGVLHLPHPVAAAGLLPVRAHDLGQRPAGASGGARLRGRHRGAQHRGPRGARLGASTSGAGAFRTPGRTASRWSPSAPACCGSAGTASTPGASSSVDATTAAAFINTDLAASFAGVAWLVVEWMTTRKPKFLGPPDRLGGGPRHDHAGRRLRLAPERGADRDRLGRRVLLRRGAQEPAPVGRRARRVGVHGVGGFIGIVHARGVRDQGLQSPRAQTACWPATRRSSSASAWRRSAPPCGRSRSRSGCCG